MNTIYRRSESNWIGSVSGNPNGYASANYWRKFARGIFERNPNVEAVEIVKTGNKLDSLILCRGDKHAPAGWACIIASTGGKWGKSRRDYFPKS